MIDFILEQVSKLSLGLRSVYGLGLRYYDQVNVRFRFMDLWLISDW